MSSIHNINDALLVVYLFVSDYLDAHPAVRDWRRSNNRKPPLTDAEVITVALMQGCLGCATLKQTYQVTIQAYSTSDSHLKIALLWHYSTI